MITVDSCTWMQWPDGAWMLKAHWTDPSDPTPWGCRFTKSWFE